MVLTLYYYNYIMATKKHPIPAYLDNIELKKLESIATVWGCSMSAVIKRLIREYTKD
jgi:flavorubredoxin